VRRTIGCVLPLVLLLTGCATTVEGIASPGPTTAHAAAPSLPGGASPSCLVDDGCDDPADDPSGGRSSTRAANFSCETLPAAVASFDAAAEAAFPGWQAGRGTPGQLRVLQATVNGLVDVCGYKVMVDVADQFPDPGSYDLLVDANMALGGLLLEPGGLRCADLQARGYGAKEAVDYWFLWEAPALMDADLNGTPCETVFSDVERYMPAYY
jgi:hypothetical protein